MEFFTIKHKKTGNFPSVSVSSNDGADFCNSYSAQLDFSSNPESVWVVTSKEKAERVLNDPVEWYNSGTSRPQMPRGFKAEDYIVVELTNKE